MGRAHTFAEYVDLIRDTERDLIAAGQTNVEDRVMTIRGIYYGTEWSLDYAVEGSMIRNTGFFVYTTGVPADPRPLLTGTLFADVQASQSMVDGTRRIDVGHIIIGLETRFRSVRTTRFPNQGGTGLEITTWLGDLGGGAARLALHRAGHPSITVERIFQNSTSDFGVTDNLEGDIGSYLVASGGVAGGPAVFPSGSNLADELEAYFLTSGSLWPTRAASFAAAIGAAITGSTITNAATLTSDLADKIEEFACWYAATRYLPNGSVTPLNAGDVCAHLRGAAEEVATVFVALLGHAISHPTQRIESRPPYPSPTPAATTECSCSLLAATAAGREAFEGAQRQFWRAKDLLNHLF